MSQREGPLTAFGILGFGGGVSLAVYILSGLSLALGLGAMIVCGALGGRVAWTRSTEERRAVARERLRAGLLAGAGALAAYDATRWAVARGIGGGVDPFEAFGAFGVALWGPSAEGWWVDASGIAFHVLNGLGFAVAFTMLAGARGPAMGIAFALGLELFMMLLYPQWLRLQALDEFLQVSMVGHVAYGATLGALSRSFLRTNSAPPGAKQASS